MHVVATAGHVDHGKSTLILTLTGTDPDRWAEEKQRGLTIDLGFAHTTLATGADVSFVDVPGHVRFLKNMLAGVGAVDACLFVVAATEGWKPQTEEHLRILDLLGVSHGVVALTKAALVDHDLLELAMLDVAEHVEGTFLEHAEVVPVDAPTGLGVDELQAALGRLLAVTPVAEDRGRPRLWIDRVFAAKGSGTVVTGTLTGGVLKQDDELAVVSATGVRDVRVRTLQTHGQKVASVTPGHRVAVNLAGVDHGDVERGDALVRKAQWHRTKRFDARLDVLASLDHNVSRRGAFAVALGSGESSAKVRILGDAALEPGSHGLVRIHLPTTLPLAPGDRFILRDHGREETVGGGEILDVDPRLPASKARPDRSVARVVAERSWVDAAQLERLTGQAWTGPLLAGSWVVDPGALTTERNLLRARVADAGPLGLDPAGLTDRARAVLPTLADEGIGINEGRVRTLEQPDPLANHPFIRTLSDNLFSPPDALSVDRTELRELVRRGLVVERDGVYFSPLAIAQAALAVARLLVSEPDGVTVAMVRDELGNSRKHVLPLLAHLDATGVTRRRGDVRIGGPKLPTIVA